MSDHRTELLDELVALVADALAERIGPNAVSPDTQTRGREAWRLYSLEEAAAMFGRSTRWVRDRVKRGDLVRVRLDGGAMAFELADLQAFAQARRVTLDEPSALAARLQSVREAA